MTRKDDPHEHNGPHHGDYSSREIGGGWELSPVTPWEFGLLAQTHDAEVEAGDPGALLGGVVAPGAAWVIKGKVVAGVVYRRENRLATYYSAADHEN
jgi:hypothetical protein